MQGSLLNNALFFGLGHAAPCDGSACRLLLNASERATHAAASIPHRGTFNGRSAQLESGQRRVVVIAFLALAELVGFDPEKAIREIR